MSDVVNEVAKDMFGREVRVGDICVYPVRRGSNMWMNRITVMKISHDPRGAPALGGQKQDGYPVTVTSLDRVALIGRSQVVPFMD